MATCPKLQRLINTARDCGWEIEEETDHVDGCTRAEQATFQSVTSDGRAVGCRVAYGVNSRTGRWVALTSEGGRNAPVAGLVECDGEPEGLMSFVVFSIRAFEDMLTDLYGFECVARDGGWWPACQHSDLFTEEDRCQLCGAEVAPCPGS